MLNQKGTYIDDLTLTRINDNSYILMLATGMRTKTKHYMIEQ